MNFGHLCDFILFMQIWLRTKIEKHLTNSLRKRKGDEPSTAQRANAAHASRPTTGAARARWRSCKNALVLSGISMSTTRTIPIDNDFARKPSYTLVFASERSPTPPCSLAWH
jgi:hypothetical protein